MNDQIVICDQKFLNASLVPAAALGKPGGCPAGVYETLLWDKGQFAYWEKHIERLAAGCAYAGLNFSDCERAFTRKSVESLAEKNEMASFRCRLRLMTFFKPVAMANSGGATFRHLAAVWPAAGVGTSSTAFACAVSSENRKKGDPSYNHKLLGRYHMDIDLAVATAAGFNDVLYFNTAGELCEAVYANVWLVKGSELFTPPVDAPCLPGIVRGEVIAAAKKIGLKVHANKAVTHKDMSAANEIFLSSSIRGIQRVTAVEGIWTTFEASESKLLSILREQVMI